ncbi:WD repeat-containing protein 90 isoform X1 [Scleropages formosus]|uniref:WD repeat-containing protein 90 isoform X1 n=1 Tax=Scleropages formosus TaxID=113540 RepID=UPI0010FA6B40|nr:WD repeat-containing protein 90 isoform X1 [Scleropages formosus]
MSSKAWQQPYVNIFKHVKVEEWRRSTKEGDVAALTDKTLKSAVYRIRGCIPASNYILLPKTGTQTLGLTGRYFYLLFRPAPSKHFVVHVDVASEESQVVRVSFSNLFKEFKSTATWLQFPFLCGAAKGSVYESTARTARHGERRDRPDRTRLVGPAPASVRWTCLVLDLRYILSVYLNRHYSHLKSIRLCASMSVKNVFTSDILFDPGLSFTEAKQAGVSLQGACPMPREMCFPVPKGEDWHDLYDYIRFPSTGAKMPHDSFQRGRTSPAGSGTCRKSPVPELCRSVDLSKPVRDRISVIEQMTTPKPRPRHRAPLMTTRVPELGLPSSDAVVSDLRKSQKVQADFRTSEEEGAAKTPVASDGSVHVFARREHNSAAQDGDGETEEVVSTTVSRPLSLPSKKASKLRVRTRFGSAPFDATLPPLTPLVPPQKLQPDPILKLKRIFGFGGRTTKCAVWTKAGDVVYPCHAVIVAMNVASGQQRFFIGHTDKVSALAFNGSSAVLASAQAGTLGVVRLWNYSRGDCVAVFKTPARSLSSLSFSRSGGVLCGVGKDKHGKTMVVVWNTQRATKGGEVAVLAKAHSDVDVHTMKIAFFDDTRMVSCGRDNIRLWRVRGGMLRSCPVNLGEYHTLDFTDVAFEEGYSADRDPEDRTLFASSGSGHILEIDYKTVAIKNVRRLLPAPQTRHQRRDKQTLSTAPGIAVNSISISSAFCATGSEDGYLRLWPLDFSAVFLEAEHEGPVTLVSISSDGLGVLAATATGNLGYLDVGTRQYSTLMRSHTDTVLGFSVDGVHRHITTASRDGTVRVWDLDSMQQLYDFVSEDTPDTPCSVAFHPSGQVFSCGSSSGTVRVFNIADSTLLAEHKQHRGEVIGVTFSPDGECMYSACSSGTLCLYNSSQEDHRILRVLGNVVARGSERGPDALSVSSDSRSLAFVGPSEYTVMVMDARSLDELLRVDVSILDAESTSLESAVRACFPPVSTGHLLVSTSANKILWLSAQTGRLLREVSKVHTQQCSSMSVSEDGRFLLTAGHKAVKVWDYSMRLDVNAQVFIGHSQPIQQVAFTPDQLGVVSVGDAIYYWDFLAHQQESASERSSPSLTSSPPAFKPGERVERRRRSAAIGRFGRSFSDARRSEAERTDTPTRSAPAGSRELDVSMLARCDGTPRKAAPLPSSSPPCLDAGSSHSPDHEALDTLSLCEDTEDTELDTPPPPAGGSFLRVTDMVAKDDQRTRTNGLRTATAVPHPGDEQRDRSPVRPDAYRHFTPRFKMFSQAQCAAAPPAGQEGLLLKAVIGYNGNGRGNMVWNPDTGLFAYSCGCVVVVEDLHTGSQQHWLGHTEEISSLAVSNDAQTLASASAGRGGSQSRICIWDVRDAARKNTMSYHKGEVQAIAFSRDDLLFVSVGDYTDLRVALWSTGTYQLLSSIAVPEALHDVGFSPTSAGHMTCVGSAGATFCFLQSRGQNVELKVHRVPVPEQVGEVELTALCYSTESILYTGTNRGHVCAWECATTRCFMSWEADEGEIGVLLCRGNRLMTGSNTRRIRLWAVTAVRDFQLGGHTPRSSQDRSVSVLMEQEMTLDGTVASAAFDAAMDIGIVGTTAGTLWYINWVENSSIRLISGHRGRVSSVVFSPSEKHFATCGEDGSVRVWSAPSNELVVQFQVLNQSCTCICWSALLSPDRGDQRVAAGYSDGTLRVFRIATSEMELKLQPHQVTVTAVQCSAEGQVLLSGGKDGLVAVSSPLTGMTVRVITDHKGAPLSTIQCVTKKHKEFGLEGSEMWLAASADRRVSVWVSDWTQDRCELLDWLTFPAHCSHEEPGSLPPSLGAFCPCDPGVVLYTGYGAEMELSFYSLSKKQFTRKIALSHWATCLSLSPRSRLVAVGSNERLLKLIKTTDGKFQDFPTHSDAVQVCQFSPSGRFLFTSAYNEIFLWEVKGL